MLRKIVTTALLTAGLSVAAVAAQAETVKIHGSSTVANTLLLPNKAAIESASGMSLAITGNGSSRGIADLMAGKSDMGAISAPLDITVAKINKKKPGSVDGSQLQAHKVGETVVAFALHKSNPVKNLTMAQLSDILSGKVKNWKDVGGADKAIVVVVEGKGGGVRSMVEKEVLKGGDIKAKAKEVPNSAQVVKIVGQLPHALGIAISATIGGNTVAAKTDQVIAQPLILVTKGAPSASMTKVIDAARSVGG